MVVLPTSIKKGLASPRPGRIRCGVDLRIGGASPREKGEHPRFIKRVDESGTPSLLVGMVSGKTGHYLNEAAIFQQAGKGDAVHPSEGAAKVRRV
jgi:hypothetical protein